jgi:hypothetical protein
VYEQALIVGRHCVDQQRVFDNAGFFFGSTGWAGPPSELRLDGDWGTQYMDRAVVAR